MASTVTGVGSDGKKIQIKFKPLKLKAKDQKLMDYAMEMPIKGVVPSGRTLNPTRVFESIVDYNALEAFSEREFNLVRRNRELSLRIVELEKLIKLQKFEDRRCCVYNHPFTILDDGAKCCNACFSVVKCETCNKEI